MLWQDIVIALTNVVFSISLIPQVYHGFHHHAGPIQYQTSIPIALGLFTLAVTFWTLSLYISVLSATLQGLLWLILVFQRAKYHH